MKQTQDHDATDTAPARLRAEDITIGYDRRTISRDLSVRIPDGSFTVIVGPNACGKSTLLRGLSKLLKPSSGQVVLDGKAITSYRAKEVARVLGLLPQTSLAPDGITVADLIARGRHPHQKLIKQWSVADEAALLRAMEATDVSALSGRPVDELSGGQRQRVWVAMVLAQETPCCCSTNRRPSSTSRTRSSCWNCSRASTGRAAPWWRCCTISTRPLATERT